MEISAYRWIIVGTLWLAHVINFLNISTLGIFAPFFKADLNLSSAQIGLLISAVALGGCLASVPLGLITDLFGSRFILALCILLMGLFWSLFSFVTSYRETILILLAFGLASCGIAPTASRSVLVWFPPIGRATAMALKQTGVNFGGILAGILLPFLALQFTWRSGLLMVGVAEGFCAAFIYLLLREPPHERSGPLPSLAWRKALALLLNRDVLVLGSSFFFFFACQFSFSTYLALFLIQEQHYSLVQAGFLYALAFFTGAAARIVWSLASDYWLGGRRKGILLLITWMELLSLLTLCLVSFFPAVSRFLILVVIVFGMSGIGYNAILLTIMAEATPKELVAMATSIGFFFGFIGNLICPPLFGYLVDLTGSYGYSWLFLASCAAATLVLLQFSREPEARVRPAPSGSLTD